LIFSPQAFAGMRYDMGLSLDAAPPHARRAPTSAFAKIIAIKTQKLHTIKGEV
jgi:hypothetical protein